MAYVWDSEPTGTLRVQFSGSSSSKNFAGVNSNVLNSSPEVAVAQVNKLVGIGGLSVVTNTSTKFTETSGVAES